MEMKFFIFSFIAVIVSMILIDGVWLAVMASRFYIPNVGHLFKEAMELWPAVTFYIIYAVALSIFVVLPALKNNTGYIELFLLGLLFGMVTYGTYDLTNQVTLKNWPWIVTVVDIAWGSTLAGIVSLISTFLTRHFFVL